MSPQLEILQGTVDLLILKTLSLQPLHGVGISDRIHQLTRGAFRIKPGSLFPALHRLEQRGWISGEWGLSDNNRKAKYYQLTAVGRRQLKREEHNWQETSLAIRRVLEAPGS